MGGSVWMIVDMDSGAVRTAKKLALAEGIAVEDRRRLGEDLARLQGLRHPRLAHVTAFWVTPAELGIEREYVSNSLATVLSEFGALDGGLQLRLAEGVLEGLVFLHSRSPPVAHGSLSSAHVLLDQDFSVHLTDFGCRSLPALLRSGGGSGVAAPEAQGRARFDPVKADIWALGCVLVDAATARGPRGPEEGEGTLPQEPRLPPAAALAGAPRQVARACLRPDPASRPSATELAALLPPARA